MKQDRYMGSSPIVPVGRSVRVKSIPVNKLCADWNDQYGIDIAKELAGIESIELYRCLESGIEFFLPKEAAGSPALYAALQHRGNFYQTREWEYSAAAKDLAHAYRILDVGAGEGHFIEFMTMSRDDLSIAGIESNPAAVEAARKKGLTVGLQTLRDIVRSGETFNAVTLFQVLEHMSEPFKFLQEIVKLVQPGGLLIITVPSNEGLLKHNYNLLNMPPHHMTRWESKTFRYLERLLPFKIIKMMHEPLDVQHSPGFISSLGARLRFHYSFMGWTKYKLIQKVSTRLLQVTGIYRFARGHTLYVLLKINS